MKTSNKRSHDHASMQQHEQHFINGIGDGKLTKMDLPDESRHRNIRQGFRRKHETSFGGRHKIDFEYYERSASISDLPEDQKAEKITPNAIPQEKIDSNHHLQDLGENFEVHIMKLITILGFFVVFSLATNMQASRKRRKIKSKLKRTDSLLVRQKKKTDDWGEDGDFEDYQSDMPIRDPSPTYFDMREGNNNLHNRKKTGSENRARRRSTVALKKDDFLPHQHKFVVDGGGLDGLDGFDISNPSSSKTLHESGESDDEEMSSPKASPSRCTLQSSSTLTSVGSDLDGQAERDVETPTRSTKPTIYVDSFAQLTMPNISKSPVRTEVSDGNAKFDRFLDEIELSRSVSRVASSDDTEGAKHKQKDLTAFSDAASSLYVDSFAQLNIPNVSKSPVRTEVSDGNAKFDSFRDEIELSKSVSRAVSSGETEGANGILHKRKDLTACSDAASSLHSPITFSELKLDSMIGGGGFGQVWRATWRGTPVAVKVLSASSQAYNVQKAILQEFAAEINMLSGMRHPNICLYIGACLEPSNRAIVTGKFRGSTDLNKYFMNMLLNVCRIKQNWLQMDPYGMHFDCH